MEGLKEEIIHQLHNPIEFTIPLFNGIPVSQSVVTSWITMAAIMLLTLVFTRSLKVRNPGKAQVMLEMGVDFINGFVKANTGKHWRSFAPYIGTVAIYLVLSNTCGIFGLIPPTKDVNITAALALMSAALIYGALFRCNGLVGGLKHFVEPVPLLLPINLMEIAVRPLALCMRLFGNILGAHLIMELIKYCIPVIVPAIFSVYFDLFDGAIQATVFVFLTTLFLGEGIHHEE